MATLDVNKGGYKAADPGAVQYQSASMGQTNPTSGKAYLWIQNPQHTWKNVYSNATITPQSGTVKITLIPNTGYAITWWNTYSGAKTLQNLSSDGTGALTLNVTTLTDDQAVTIAPTTLIPTPTPTATPTPSPTATPPLIIGKGDVNGDGVVTIADVVALINNWSTQVTAAADQYPDSVINSLDFAAVVTTLTKATPTPTATPTPVPTPIPTPTPTATPAPTPTPSPTAPPVTSTTNWEQFQHDSQHTGRTAVSVAPNYHLKWAWIDKNHVAKNPVLGPDKTVMDTFADKGTFKQNVIFSRHDATNCRQWSCVLRLTNRYE